MATGVIQLSARLRAAGERVPVGARVTDVGTDHAQLPIWLVQKGISPAVIAADLRTGPLKQAAGNVNRWGLSQQIQLRLCDGLTGIAPEETDAVTMCGMGGETIRNILRAAPWTREKQLILQPQSNAALLRRFLCAEGYEIKAERVTEDQGFYYIILEVTGGYMEPLTPGEAHGGRLCDWVSSPQRGAWLARVTGKLTRELAGLDRSKQDSDAPRREELRAALEELRRREEELRQREEELK